MMDLDYRGGLRYLGINIAKVTVLFIAVGIVGLYALDLLRDFIPGDPSYETPVTVILFPLLSLAVPYLAMSFVAGCFEPGTRYRLYSRIVMNAYLVVRFLMLTGEFGYVLEDIVNSVDSSIMMSGASIVLNPATVMALLTAVPAMSIIDSFLEYLQYSDPEHHGDPSADKM